MATPEPLSPGTPVEVYRDRYPLPKKYIPAVIVAATEHGYRVRYDGTEREVHAANVIPLEAPMPPVDR